MIDIILCKEKKCIELAKKLGIDNLIFAERNHGLYKVKNLKLYQADEKIRHVLERKKPDIMFGAETIQPKDFIHQRGAGLNHILCRLMRDNRAMYAFSFAMLLEATKKPLILGRIMQNIKLLRKYNVPMLVVSLAEKPTQMRSPENMAALFRDLGMHNKEINDGWEELKNRL